MLIAGVDEVGRGPLAGPVVCAAVIFGSNIAPEGVMDSKKVSEKKRSILSQQIKDSCLSWALGQCCAEEIDELNIHNATLLAMQRAVKNLSTKPDKILVDGKFCPNVDVPCEAIIKGDSKIIEISAASIVAKVFRDDMMIDYHQKHPEYGFASHKGYPTKLHVSKLLEHGILSIHRKSYAPVKKIIEMV
jgi:ribonuclease HII